MAMSFTRPDPGNPSQIADATFSTTRRGFDQAEVRDFLQMVAAEMSRLGERVRFLEREVDAAQTSPEVSARLDEETLTRLLGEETARVLSAARVSAAEIREKAEHAAAQLVSEASDEAARIREEVEVEASRRRADAAADSEAELEMAKQQGREMVNEARAYRERVLSELSRRRELAREQIEQLVHGRDRLVAAFERARAAAVDVISDLEPLGEPDEYVNLTPTTGPVPVMVAREDDDAAESEPDDDTTDGGSAEVIEIDAADVDTEPPPAADEDEHSDAEDTADQGDDEQAPDDEVVGTGDADGDASDDAEADDGAAAEDASGDVVVDLFARLRSATDTTGADGDAQVEHDAETDDAQAQAATHAADSAHTEDTADADESAGAPVAHDSSIDDTVAGDADHDVEPGVDPADAPFEQRDAELTPLIVAAARKLKRVLADEQNDVLDALRTASAVTGLDDLVPVEPEQSGRYVDAISDDLLVAAQVGASSTRADGVVTLTRKHARSSVDTAGDHLAERLIALLRSRLDRAIVDTDGDLTALTKKVRAVYREVKTRHIDDVLDDVFRAAHGAGQFAAIPTDESVVWICDQRHPCGADCEDNALSPAVPHGAPFPTGHTSPPAHPGCRCLLQIAPR